MKNKQIITPMATTTMKTRTKNATSHSKTVTCTECGIDIIFSNRILGKNKREIPLDANTHEVHNCTGYVRECYYCKTSISFGGNMVDKKGRKVPVDEATLKPHRCNKEKIKDK